MSADAVIYVVVALAIALAALVLLTFVFFQRRRQRTMLLLALAQEDAERRRRKKRKVALRRWEIDHAAPEALVYRVAAQPAQHTLTLQSNPAQYADVISSLRSSGYLPSADADIRASSSLQASVTHPPPTSNGPITTATQLPQLLVAIPLTETNCVICLEPIIVGQRVRSLPCKHIYHSQCIRVWLRRKNACPCCCHRVMARKRKRSNNHSSFATGTDRPVTLEPTRPPRLNDRGENNTLHNTMSRDKSSFLSRQSDDVSIDRYNSDTTSQLDEHNTAELLSQVRSALRGQSSLLSLDTACSAEPSDMVLAQQDVSDTLPTLDDMPRPGAQQLQQTPFLRGDANESAQLPYARLAPTGLRIEPTEGEATLDVEAITPAPHAFKNMRTPGIGNS
ncbi:unnamed protein product [Agarophyton chilense]